MRGPTFNYRYLVLCTAAFICVFFGESKSVAQGCIATVRVTPNFAPSGGVTAGPLPPLQATLNGRPVPVISEVFVSVPMRAIIVLDASGSMRNDDKDSSGRNWRMSLQIARNIITYAPMGSSFGLLAFSGKNTLEGAITRNAASLRLALDQLRDYNGSVTKGDKKTTPLWDAVIHANSMLGLQSKYDTLIVITDGGDNASRSTKEQMRSQLIASSVRLFTVSFSTVNPYPEEQQGSDYMRELAEESGGWATTLGPLFLRNYDEQIVTSIAARIVELDSKTYELTLGVPPTTKSGKLSIAARGKKTHLLYPHNIAPCATQ